MRRVRSWLALGAAGLLAPPLSALAGVPLGVLSASLIGCAVAAATLPVDAGRRVRV